MGQTPASDILDALTALSHSCLDALGLPHEPLRPVPRVRPWLGQTHTGVAYHATAGRDFTHTLRWFLDPKMGNTVSSAHVVIDDGLYDDAIGALWSRADKALLALFPVPTLITASWIRGTWCTNWINNRCLGIELRNAMGKGGLTTSRSRRLYGISYEMPTQPQMVAAIRIGQLAVALAGERYNPDTVVGHHQVNAAKADPGPCFPLRSVRAALTRQGLGDPPPIWIGDYPPGPMGHDRPVLSDPAPARIMRDETPWLPGQMVPQEGMDEDLRRSDMALLVALGWDADVMTPGSPRWQAMIGSFQRSTLFYEDPARHLWVDGICGPKTAAALRQRLIELRHVV